MNDKDFDRLLGEALHIAIPKGLGEKLEKQIDRCVEVNKKNLPPPSFLLADKRRRRRAARYRHLSARKPARPYTGRHLYRPRRGHRCRRTGNHLYVGTAEQRSEPGIHRQTGV